MSFLSLTHKFCMFASCYMCRFSVTVLILVIFFYNLVVCLLLGQDVT